MIEADLPTMVTLANDTARLAMQAGPPTDLPAQVPAFVEDILGEVGASAGETADGLGEAVSDLTPGAESAEGGEAATNATNATEASESAADAPGK